MTEVDSPFIFIDKETLSFRSEGIFYIIKLIYFRHDHYEQNFKSLRAGRHENSIVGMDPMATHCRKLIVTKQIRHVTLIGIRAEGTIYAINIKM